MPHIYAASTLEVRKTCFSATSKCSAPTLGEDKNMFARLYQNKCSKFLIMFLSKVCCKKRHGLCKNIEDGHKRFQSRKKRKREKEKEMRIKITHVLAKIFYKREIYFREHSRIRLATTYSTHMHILIFEYGTSLLGSRV